MANFRVYERARHLTDRLRRAPSYLVRTELESLLNLLHSDETTRLLLQSLLQREPSSLKYAGWFIRGELTSALRSLSFIKTAEQRAAFGYQVVCGLLDNSSPTKVCNIVVSVGKNYAEANPTTASIEKSGAIRRFCDIFVDPIIDYLEGAQNVDDLVLATMVRYKQRSEWFEKGYLLEIAKSLKREGKSFSGNVEERLKADFYRYLFDRGIEFVIEAKSPKGGGATDVLTARLHDGRRLVVEAKVFDALERNESHVKGGIEQASSYAEEWAEPRAYLLVYNIAANTVLEFRGASQDANVWLTSALGKEVRIIVVNLNNTLLASQASKLSRVTINLV